MDRPETLPAEDCAGNHMENKMSDCTHDILKFSSGDYYLFCQECPKSWVLRGDKGDLPAPELSGPGPDNQYRVVSESPP